MLTIPEYRTSIRRFYARLSVGYVSTNSNQKQQRSHCFYKRNHLMAPILFLYAFFIVFSLFLLCFHCFYCVFIVFIVFSLYFLNLYSAKFQFDKLIVDGIENNPGPTDYSIEMWFREITTREIKRMGKLQEYNAQVTPILRYVIQ